MSTVRTATSTESAIGSIRAAESVVYFARRRHAESANQAATFQPTQLAEKLESDDVRVKRDFVPDTIRLLGTIESDYGFEKGRFVPG